MHDPMPNDSLSRCHWMEPELQRHHQSFHGCGAVPMSRWTWSNDSLRCTALDPGYFCPPTC